LQIIKLANRSKLLPKQWVKLFGRFGSKLVREGVYVAAEKTAKAKRDEGPTKKEMLIQLETLATFPVEGFMGATKEAIQALISHLKA
jgi:hypothetical protein